MVFANFLNLQAVDFSNTFANLQQLLAWLTGSSGGAFIVVAWMAAWGFEKFPFWSKLDSGAKSLVIVAIAGLLGAVSVFLTNRPDIVSAIDPYFRPLMYAVLAWLSTQTAHGSNKLRVKEKVPEQVKS